MVLQTSGNLSFLDVVKEFAGDVPPASTLNPIPYRLSDFYTGGVRVHDPTGVNGSIPMVGSGSSLSLKSFLGATTGPPDNVRVTANTAAIVSLAWDLPPLPTIDRYVVTDSVSNTSQTTMVPSLNYTTVIPGQAMNVSVQIVNKKGVYGRPSAPKSFTVNMPANPSIPTSISFNAAVNYATTVSTTFAITSAPSNGPAPSYTVTYVRTDGTSVTTSCILPNVTLTLPVDGSKYTVNVDANYPGSTSTKSNLTQVTTPAVLTIGVQALNIDQTKYDYPISLQPVAGASTYTLTLNDGTTTTTVCSGATTLPSSVTLSIGSLVTLTLVVNLAGGSTVSNVKTIIASAVNYDFTSPSSFNTTILGTNWTPSAPSISPTSPYYIKLATGQYGRLMASMLPTSVYTFEMLINIDYAITGFPYIIAIGTTRVQLNDSYKPYIYNGNSSPLTTALVRDTWYHLCMGSDGVNYINSVAQAKNVSFVAPPFTSAVTVMIGSSVTNQDASFLGKIAMCRAFSKIMTLSEVQSSYSSYKGAYGLLP
jgi:hypothetical protein